MPKPISRCPGLLSDDTVLHLVACVICCMLTVFQSAPLVALIVAASPTAVCNVQLQPYVAPVNCHLLTSYCIAQTPLVYVSGNNSQHHQVSAGGRHH